MTTACGQSPSTPKPGRVPGGYPLKTVLAALACALVVVPTLALPPASGGPGLPVPLVRLETVAQGLNQPLGIVNAGDGSGRLFILEQVGTVRHMVNGVLQPDAYLDIRSKVTCCGERGLLGLAFHPQFETNGILFSSYTDTNGNSVVEKYVVANPASGKPNPAQATIVIGPITQPYSNHNGGHIAFGPDGYLWFALGDGGSSGDPGNRAQNPNNILGKMLRLDVDNPSGGRQYGIPADNPYASGGGLPEIWSRGLRNPWKFSFDRETGDLWIGDVGQNLMEEVNYEPRGTPGGRNYGWKLWEGSLPYQPLSNPSPAGMTFPVLEYPHPVGCSITGGNVYRGGDIPGLVGAYLYSDYCTGWVWMARGEGDTWESVIIGRTTSPTAFGEDEAGELYVTLHSSAVGAVLKFRPVA